MKRIIFAAAMVIGLAAARPIFAQERIIDFQAVLRVSQDGTIRVSEGIDYDFGAADRHGIFRELPLSYKTDQGSYSVRLSDISASGPGEQMTFSQSRTDGMLKLTIGDRNKVVSGKQHFVVSYTVSRAINYFNNQDELYWNATGNGWPVPIEAATARVVLPAASELSQLKTACFAGALGSKTSCSNISFPELIDPNSGSAVSQIEFRQGSLAAGDGLSVIVGMPKGLVSEPSRFSGFLYVISDNYIVLLPVAVLIIMLCLWYARGRDPKGRGTIIAQFEAPDGLTPAEVGTIVDEEADNLDISAELIHLAINGYLKINQIKEKGLVFDTEDYRFDKLKDQSDLANEFDRHLMTAIFKGREQVRLSELKKTIYKDLAMIKELIYRTTVSKGYFKTDPGKTKAFYLLLGGTSCTIGILARDPFGYLFTLSFIASGVIIAAIGWFMPARTAKGVEVRERILGFKNYMQVAEKDRLDFHNAPEKNPATFEKFLPYAICLKVEKQWAGQFAGAYENQETNWYGSYNHAAFNALILTDSLHQFSAKSTAMLGASAAGHKSGFGGGGGFSGGGFGGGGGGSW